MEAATEQKLVSVVGLTVAIVAFTLTIIEQIQIDKSVREAAALGAIIDVSPDQFQFNFRVALALALGSISLWSGRANRWAIVAGFVFWAAAFLLFLDLSPFDREKPIVHITGLAGLVAAGSAIRRRQSGFLTAVLAGTFILVNYFLWFLSTERLKRLAERDELYPYTRLNNLLYGASWWHVAFFSDSPAFDGVAR